MHLVPLRDLGVRQTDLKWFRAFSENAEPLDGGRGGSSPVLNTDPARV